MKNNLISLKKALLTFVLFCLGQVVMAMAPEQPVGKPVAVPFQVRSLKWLAAVKLTERIKTIQEFEDLKAKLPGDLHSAIAEAWIFQKIAQICTGEISPEITRHLLNIYCNQVLKLWLYPIVYAGDFPAKNSDETMEAYHKKWCEAFDAWAKKENIHSDLMASKNVIQQLPCFKSFNMNARDRVKCYMGHLLLESSPSILIWWLNSGYRFSHEILDSCLQWQIRKSLPESSVIPAIRILLAKGVGVQSLNLESHRQPLYFALASNKKNIALLLMRSGASAHQVFPYYFDRTLSLPFSIKEKLTQINHQNALNLLNACEEEIKNEQVAQAQVLNGAIQERETKRRKLEGQPHEST